MRNPFNKGRTVNIVLGNRYRDKVSGWEGIATARYEYMNGCVRYCLDAKDKDGAPTGHVFDVQQIEEVVGAVVAPDPKPRGGPRTSTPPARR